MHALQLRGICKSYPGVRALAPTDLDFEVGEVHALIGENGAGKSTLVKLITGAERTDAGQIILGDTELIGHSPAQSLGLGIGAMYQEFSLFPELTVAENIFYGREPRRGPFVDFAAMRAAATEALAEIGAEIAPTARLGSLSVGQQQLVELAKSVTRDVRVLIMDEPTSPLTTREVRFLYEAVRRLKAKGVTIIYISHRLQELFDLCDRVTVMRDGQRIATLKTAETTEGNLVSLMVGRTLNTKFPPPTSKIGDVVLRVEHLQSDTVHDLNLEVRAGEIVGLGGLIGAGRTEAARLIFGADAKSSGIISIDGIAADIRSPSDAIANGIGLVPEDRKHQGLLLDQSVRFNIVYASLSKLSAGIFAHSRHEREAADRYIASLRIRTPSSSQMVRNLSGGNQQKIVLAKWLLTESRVLIFDEPTRGIDVGAKQEIYALMRTLTERGVAIIMISSEMPELLGMSDRVVVLHKGAVTGELSREEFTQEEVLRLASGLSTGGVS